METKINSRYLAMIISAVVCVSGIFAQQTGLTSDSNVAQGNEATPAIATATDIPTTPRSALVQEPESQAGRALALDADIEREKDAETMEKTLANERQARDAAILALKERTADRAVPALPNAPQTISPGQDYSNQYRNNGYREFAGPDMDSARNPGNYVPQQNLQSNFSPNDPRENLGRIYQPPVSPADQEMVQIYNKILELTQRLKVAETEEQKDDLKEEIKVQLESQYESYLAQHEAPLLELEARLEKLRTEFEWRKNAKDDLVKLRLDTIWYDSQGLGWPGGQPTTHAWSNTYANGGSAPTASFNMRTDEQPRFENQRLAPAPNILPPAQSEPIRNLLSRPIR